MKNTKAFLAEMIGTFVLVFVNIGAVCAANHQQMDLLGIALAYGLATAAMVSATAALSGGHLNPAVTFGVFIGGKMEIVQAVRHIIAQLLGAVAAALLCMVILEKGAVSAATPNLPLDHSVSVGAAILTEAILTFVLTFVMFGTVIDTRGPKIGGVAVGLVVAAGVLFGQKLTGAAMNPAFAFGPAVAGSQWANHSVYWVGPLLGAGLAGAIYGRFLILPDQTPLPKKM